MKDKKHIDHIFRDSFENFTPLPQPDDFSKFTSVYLHHRRKKKVLFVILSAACLAIFTTVFVFLPDKKPAIKHELNHQRITNTESYKRNESSATTTQVHQGSQIKKQKAKKSCTELKTHNETQSIRNQSSSNLAKFKTLVQTADFNNYKNVAGNQTNNLTSLQNEESAKFNFIGWKFIPLTQPSWNADKCNIVEFKQSWKTSENKTRNHIIPSDWGGTGFYLSSDYLFIENHFTEEGFSITDISSFRPAIGVGIHKKLGRIYSLSTFLFFGNKEYMLSYHQKEIPGFPQTPDYSDYQFSFINLIIHGSYYYLKSDMIHLYLFSGLETKYFYSEIIRTFRDHKLTTNPFPEYKRFMIGLTAGTGFDYPATQHIYFEFAPEIRINLNSGLVKNAKDNQYLIKIRNIFPGAYLGVKYIF